MDHWLEALAATPLAEWMRYSRWGYAAINTLHVFSVALLVGAIVPLDLKLMGFWRRLNTELIAQVLVPVAITGLLGAIASGVLLFLAGPADYAGLKIFLIKMLLIVLATLNALNLHWRIGYAGRQGALRVAGALSLLLWLGVLVAGRMIAYV
ncbi:hypothetical protein [Reinekea marinisedimentorum]|uniref:Uncharacterized protein n=1 Tax=Reinekea marinisedimentorum TaxID=230495 RepID=A0A4R3I178_9GAMM|nr:hypothetical protein [Reinekea marinisedimentorum]TCS38753.1 hypothetical protein BCF53_11527 [Reinekea marinisedimentorum]